MIPALIIIGVLLIVFFLLEWPALRRHKAREDMAGRYIAHRGLHSETVPENSLAAFAEAIAHGYAIEIDIHLTADGEVVVFHDDTLDRMCGVSGSPERLTLAELKALRLAGSEQTIPTLQECLDLVAGQVPLLIEFKSKPGASCVPLCRAADAILRQYTGTYWIQSFYPFVLTWYRRHHREVCRGQLASAFPGGKIHEVLLGTLIFNVFARPDFVSYDHRHAKNVFRRLNTRLGAFPVGWTIQSQQVLDDCREDFRTYIFEQFIPRG